TASGIARGVSASTTSRSSNATRSIAAYGESCAASSASAASTSFTGTSTRPICWRCWSRAPKASSRWRPPTDGPATAGASGCSTTRSTSELSRGSRSRLPYRAGFGSLRDTLAAQAAQMLPDACRLLGHCDDIVAVHHASDLFVQSSDYEGTSNAVLEAMALETPVVATAAGGTAEIVADNVHGLI